jgi:acetyl esterase
MLRKVIRRTLIGIVLLALLAAAAVAAFYFVFQPDRKIIYAQPDGVALSLSFFGTENGRSGPRPAILFYHGGAWTAGSPMQFYPWAQHYADLGWVAISAEYRINGRHGTNAFDAVADARAAYLYVQQHATELGIDPQRIILAGGSAGGHIAATVAMTPWPQRDDVPAPVTLVLLNPAVDTVYDDKVAIAHLFEGRGEQISPMHHIGPGLPPVFIVHGMEDELVPITNSREFCERMIATGNRCDLSEYEGVGHGFFNWGGGLYDEVLADVVNYTGE